MHARPAPALRDRLLVVVPMLAFLAATTHWMSWREPIEQHFAGDVASYERIAYAAPHFTWPQIEGHVGMWLLHYLTGLAAKATGIPLHLVYYVFAFALLTVILVLVDRLLLFARADLLLYAVCMSALILDAYVFRYLALAPGMINDTAFTAAVAGTALALLRRRLGWAIVALTVAAVTRDISLPPILLGAALWVLVGPWDGRAASRRRLTETAAVIIVPVLAAAVTYWAGQQAPGHAAPFKNCCRIAQISIWGDLSRLPGSAGALAVHLARIVLGIAMPLALVAAATIVAVRRRRSPSPAVWAVLLLGGLLVAQPLLISSTWNAGAEPRLSSLAIGPIVAAVALLFVELDMHVSRLDAGVLITLFAVGSLSHRFAAIAPSTSGKFAALALSCAVLSTAWVVAGRRVLRRAGWTVRSVSGAHEP